MLRGHRASRSLALALALAAAPLCALPLLVPESPLAHPWVPHDAGVIAYPLVLVALVSLHLFAPPEKLWRAERIVLGVFLFAMPGVYLGDWLLFHGTARWLALELVGQLVFGALALLGMWRYPWLIAAGIGAHGIAWDSWHYHAGSTTPDWYALGCLVVDVGMAGYYGVRLRALHAT